MLCLDDNLRFFSLFSTAHLQPPDPSLPLNSPVTANKTKSAFRHPRVFLLNTPSGAKWKFLGVNIHHEGHSCGTVIDNNVVFFCLSFTYFTSVSALDCPSYAASKSDSV